MRGVSFGSCWSRRALGGARNGGGNSLCLGGRCHDGIMRRFCGGLEVVSLDRGLPTFSRDIRLSSRGLECDECTEERLVEFRLLTTEFCAVDLWQFATFDIRWGKFVALTPTRASGKPRYQNRPAEGCRRITPRSDATWKQMTAPR